MLKKITVVTVFLSILFQQLGFCSENKINNFINYSESFSSSGQPSKSQLEQLKKEGYQRIIYLAFEGNDSAIKNEDEIVNDLKMSYLHIPVDFMDPRIEDFELFSAVMEQSKEMKTLVHCQVNFRASAFSFLHRVISGKVPIADAKHDLDKIWEPNPIWFKFIKSVLSQHDIKVDCEDCDWSGNEFKQ